MYTGWRDVEGMSYLADRPSSFPQAFNVSMIYPETRPSQLLTLASGIRQARLHPFPNDGPLKFGKRSEQMKQELPRRGGAVELFVQGDKRHAEALELVQGHDEMFEAAAEAIEAPDEHDVHLTPTTRAE